jgi:chromate transporter
MTKQEMPPPKSSLSELAILFLKLGTIAFGGPAAHVAMMRQEVVGRLKWLTDEEFLDLYGAANVIPGPNSTELAIHIGYVRAGWAGLIVSGVCFIVPAMLTVLAFAWLYVRYGQLPEVAYLLYGVKPVIMAIVLHALWQLSKAAVKNLWLGALGLIGLVSAFLGVNELLILFAIGCVAAIAVWAKTGWSRLPKTGLLPVVLFQTGGVSAGGATLMGIFLFFLKVGSVLFGSGYVLLAFLRADLVERYGWLTNQQLLDAVAVGQITPGPVFTTATFIGYILGGVPGASVATIGIFLPAFVFVALSGWLVPRIRRSSTASGFLDGLNVSSLALMAYVTYRLGQAAIVDWLTVLLFAASAVLLIFFRINSAWLITGAGVIAVGLNFL